MEEQVQAAMAKIDAAFAQRTEQSRRDMLKDHDAETVAAIFEVGAKLWRTERQVIETRVRNALQDLAA